MRIDILVQFEHRLQFNKQYSDVIHVRFGIIRSFGKLIGFVKTIDADNDICTQLKLTYEYDDINKYYIYNPCQNIYT